MNVALILDVKEDVIQIKDKKNIKLFDQNLIDITPKAGRIQKIFLISI